MCRDGHSAIKVQSTDEWVVSQVLEIIRESSPAKQAQKLQAKLRVIERKRAELADRYSTDDDFGYSDYQAATVSFRKQSEALRTRLAALNTTGDAGTLEWWTQLSFDEKREMLRSTAEITLTQYVPGANRRKPERRVKVLSK